ncbi:MULTISPECIES: ferredoxin-NADPH reductase [unclassified Microbispora]|uniref:ferredoxin-NADPH reductase n=1 Tax=unclassified Microbispora TaxID=2614687 RepID=UPI0015FF85D3|nr:MULTISPECIES: ferredoxin-NADPH reductase [unclassified Microbispora]
MSAHGHARAPRLLRPARQETYEKLFSTVYVGLMTNVLLAVTCAPLLAALATARNPLTSWPFYVVLSVPCGPALTGAFGCFAGLGEGSTDVLRAFWRSYRRAAPRALLVWAGGAVAVSVLIVDVAAVAPTTWGPALVPFFVTMSALVMTVVFTLVVLLAEPGAVRLRPLVLPCLYLVARRWYLSALSIAVLGLAVAVVLLKPMAGLFLACSPLLYVAWATMRFVIAPILPGGALDPSCTAHPDAPVRGSGWTR